MKEFIQGIIFWGTLLLIMFALCSLAEILSNVITMKIIVKAIYIIVFIAIIFIIKK